MISRRKLLISGAAASVAGVINGVSGHANAADRAGAFGSRFRIVIEPHHEASVAFARSLNDRCMSVSEVRDDLGQLWYGELRGQLRRTRTPLAGVTDRATLFCLEELARDVDMRVRFRVDRMVGQGGRTRHEVSGQPSLAPTLRGLGTDERFGNAMASVVRLVDNSLPGDVGTLRRTGPFHNANERTLVAWIIA